MGPLNFQELTMPSTFIDLTNQLLRKFNERELEPNEFTNARGIQGRAKDIIQIAVDKINQSAWNWPFNASQREEKLVVGQEEYIWVDDLLRPEWESFEIIRDDTLNVNTRALHFRDRQDWYETQRPLDQDAGTLGRNVPDFVFKSHGNGYGVYPSPNAAYTIRYKYWKSSPRLVSATDEVNIPEQFNYVIISSAAVDMHDFYDNAEAASLMRQQYSNDLSVMRNLLLNNYNALRDTRINYGGRRGRLVYGPRGY